MNTVFFSALGFSLIAVVCFTILIARKKPDHIWNWWITFTSTFVSIVLGVGVGIFMVGYSQNINKYNEKTRITGALQAELSSLYVVLNKNDKIKIIINKDKEFEVKLFRVNQIIVDDAIRSDLFDSNVTIVLLKISHLLYTLDAAVSALQNFMVVLPSFNDEYKVEIVKWYVLNIEKFQNGLNENIQVLEHLLKTNFTKPEIDISLLKQSLEPQSVRK